MNFPDGEAPFEYRFTEVAQVKQPSSGDNDYNLCRNMGYAIISPLTANLTDFAVLKRLGCGKLTVFKFNLIKFKNIKKGEML